jgi:murein DD-endopeptidase MepM/ murein hydrolase activator NlpD
MNTKRILFLFIIIGFCAYQPADKAFPKDYFRPPINGEIKLSGSFGELRSNHFHGGIDIKPKSRGKSGDNIYASAEGYVSRIVVSPRGYGNGLYIAHPNGYTTVYGHLLNFNDEIAEYVKDLQYANETFVIDVDTLQSARFSIKKGQIIGYMGNAGSSGGAHLHFEIRDTKTGHAYNPLLFGFGVKDNIAPRLNELKIYDLNHKLETIGTNKYKIKSNKSTYSVSNGEITVGSGRVGLGLKTFDFMTGVPNWNGPYNIKMYQDDSLIYYFEVSELDLEEWYYLNAHVDYKEFKKNKSYFNRCYLLPGNGNSTVYKSAKNQGVIELREGQRAKIKLVASDITGNESVLNFTMKRAGTLLPQPVSFNYIFPHNERNAIRQSELELYFEEGSFYEDVYLSYTYSMERSDHIYSGVHHIHDKYVPVHTPFTIKMRTTRPIPDSLKSKATIVRCEGADGESGLTSKWEDDFLVAKSRSFGDYCIMLDTIPPTIKPLSFKTKMNGQNRMTFKINDNLTGIKSYNGYVDGEWILLEYDLKTRRLIHPFDGRISRGTHQLKIEVVDYNNNKGVFEQSFTR